MRGFVGILNNTLITWQTIIAVKIDWNTIDTVLLDMDGTLLDLHFDNFFWLPHLPRRYAEHHGLCADKTHPKFDRLKTRNYAGLGS